MSETRALTVRQNQITPSIWQMVREIAPAIHQSRLFGVNSAEQAMAIMLKGHELGVGLTAAFEFIKVIQGQPGLIPRGALALIHQHPELIEVKIERSDAEVCTVWMRRKDSGFEFRRTFTMAEATKAQLTKPDSGYDKWPANMLLWRCVGFCADVVCPDLIGGMKRADELGADIDRDGNMIEGSWTAANTNITQAPDQTTAKPIEITLDELVEVFGPDAVMAACEGRIPATQEEVNIAAKKLESNNG